MRYEDIEEINGLSLFPTAFSFSPAYVGSSQYGILLFANSTSEDIKVSLEIQGDNSFSVSCQELLVKSGLSATSTVVFTSREIGKTHGSLLVSTPSRDIYIPLEASILPTPLLIPTEEISRFEFSILQTVATFTLSNCSISKALNVAMDTTGPTFSITPQAITIPPMNTTKIKVEFHNDNDPFETLLNIRCTETGESIEIPLCYTNNKPIANIDMGTVTSGLTLTKNIILPLYQKLPLIEDPFVLKWKHGNGVDGFNLEIRCTPLFPGVYETEIELEDRILHIKAEGLKQTYSVERYDDQLKFTNESSKQSQFVVNGTNVQLKPHESVFLEENEDIEVSHGTTIDRFTLASLSTTEIHEDFGVNEEIGNLLVFPDVERAEKSYSITLPDKPLSVAMPDFVKVPNRIKPKKPFAVTSQTSNRFEFDYLSFKLPQCQVLFPVIAYCGVSDLIFNILDGLVEVMNQGNRTGFVLFHTKPLKGITLKPGCVMQVRVNFPVDVEYGDEIIRQLIIATGNKKQIRRFDGFDSQSEILRYEDQLHQLSAATTMDTLKSLVKSTTLEQPLQSISVSPTSIFFERREMNESAFENVIVRNGTGKSLNVRLQSERSEQFTFPESIKIQPQSSAKVKIEFRPAEYGSFQSNIYFVADGFNQCVSVFGSCIQEKKRKLDFGTIRSSGSAKAMLRVSNFQDTPSEVSIAIDPPFFCQYRQVHIEPRCFVQVPIRFTPEEPGSYKGKGTFSPSNSDPFDVWITGTAQ